MTEVICRLYGHAEQAEAAMAELRKFRFSEEEAQLIAPTAERANDLDAVIKAIVKAQVTKENAKILAAGVLRGGTLIVARPHFGRALLAIRILTQFNPIDSGVAEVDHTPFAVDDAAPLSSYLNWPTKYDEPTPLSKFWNIATLSTTSFSAHFNLPLLRDGAKTIFNYPTKLDNATPLSSWLKLPLLRDK